MVFRNSDLVFLVYETWGVMFSETTPPCFLSELNYRSAVFKVHQQLTKWKKTMLYQLQTCPIFVTILNEVKPNESNLRVRSLFFFFLKEGKKEWIKSGLVSAPPCFQTVKHDVDIQLRPVVMFGLRMNTATDMLCFNVYDVTAQVQQSPAGMVTDSADDAHV